MSNPIIRSSVHLQHTSLQMEFGHFPTSFIDGRTRKWRARRAAWDELVRPSYDGRSTELIKYGSGGATSSFDPVLCEIIYEWFAFPGATVFDPFCGGVVRGAVAAFCELEYTGVDVRAEQIENNRRWMSKAGLSPHYICADSASVEIDSKYDLIFSCPPYFDLERYSDLETDLSAQSTYEGFLDRYQTIIDRLPGTLKPSGHVVFVVGDIRKNGHLLNFPGDTISVFRAAGMRLQSRLVIARDSRNGRMRAKKLLRDVRKIVLAHDEVLIFGL